MERFTSRKFILAVVAALVVFVNAAFDLGLDQTQILTIVGTFLTFIIVEGKADQERAKLGK